MENIKIKQISINDVKFGDVLAENIMNYNELRKETVLDADKINLLKRAGVQKVRIIDFSPEEDSSVSPESPAYQPGSKDDYKKQIAENIRKAYLENIKKKRVYLELKENDFAPEKKQEVKNIIAHIEKAREEIYLIENLEKKAIKNINSSINDTLEIVIGILSDIIKNHSNKIDELTRLVDQLIQDTGPKRDAAFLLLNLKRRKDINYICRHSVNVTLIALSVAIELTKLMTEKLNDPNIRGDFKKLDICNRKIFNREELVMLGIAALLHDIGLYESYPQLSEDSKLTDLERSRMEIHPSNAFHLLTTLGMRYEIRKTVLDHHERIDGSGYPDGLKGRFFSKFGLILTFADRMEQLSTKNPFITRMHPHKALMFILVNERDKFDNDVTLAYCRAASIYPLGSWVLLSNNKIGVVFRVNKANLKKPIVKCVYSSDMQELLKKEYIDLNKSELKIIELIDIESLKFLNMDIDQYIFDEREFERIMVDWTSRINIKDSGVQIDSRVLDISLGGVRLESDKQILLGSEVLLDFQIDGKAITNKGLVVWIDGVQNPHNQYGVRFLEAPEEFCSELEKYIEKNKNKK